MRLREARCAIDKSENSYAINRGREAGCPREFFVFMAGEDAAGGTRGWRLEKRRAASKIGSSVCAGVNARQEGCQLFSCIDMNINNREPRTTQLDSPCFLPLLPIRLLLSF